MSQAAWCQAHGVSFSSFGYWRRRLREQATAVRVLPIMRAGDGAPTAPVQVHLPGGLWLQVHAQADPMRVAALVQVLRSC